MRTARVIPTLSLVMATLFCAVTITLPSSWLPAEELHGAEKEERPEGKEAAGFEASSARSFAFASVRRSDIREQRAAHTAERACHQHVPEVYVPPPERA